MRLFRKADASGARTDPSAEKQFRDRAEALLLPARARRLIDGNLRGDVPEIDVLWDFIQARTGGWVPKTVTARVAGVLRRLWRSVAERVSARAEDEAETVAPEDPSLRANVIVSAIALLATFHREQLGKKRTAWCRAFLRACLEAANEEVFDPSGPDLDFWDEFAADAVAAFWSGTARDSDMRQMVADLALRPRYVVVARLVNQCARHRASNREGFEQLVSMLAVAAQVRVLERMLVHIAQMSVRRSDLDVAAVLRDFQDWAGSLRKLFVTGRIETQLRPWSELDPARDIATFKEWRERLARRRPGVDLDLIKASHAWLPALRAAIDERERSYIQWLWREVLWAITSRREEPDDDLMPYPSDTERWVLNGIASLVVELSPVEGEEYWTPILRLEEKRAGFAEQFLSLTYRHALDAEVTLDTVPDVLSAIFDAAVSESAQVVVSWGHYDDAWLALVGLDEIARGAWQERHASLLERLIPLWKRWLQRTRIYPRHIAVLARFLTTPIARGVRSTVLPFLVNYIANDLGVAEVEPAANALGELLVLMSRDTELADGVKESFYALLQILLDKQNPIALNLYGRLGKLS